MLATLLRRHRDEIAAAWTAEVRRLPGSQYARCDVADIVQWSMGAIDAITATADGSAELEAHAREMVEEREAKGFEVDEVIEGLLLLEEIILPYIGAEATSPAEAVGVMHVLAADVRLMAAEFAKRFVASKRRAAEHMAALEERHRLARELHDSVSQSLYGVGMSAEAAARQLESGHTDAAASNLRDVCTSATDALREMRSLIFELRPSILEDEGLVPALRARLAAVEKRAGLQAKVNAEAVERLAPALEEALYGIAREALNNSLRHAHATRIDVRVARVQSTVELEVADNGVGFDVSAHARTGFGMDGMRERAAAVRASLSVLSSPGQGTTVRVCAPIEADAPFVDRAGGPDA